MILMCIPESVWIDIFYIGSMGRASDRCQKHFKKYSLWIGLEPQCFNHSYWMLNLMLMLSHNKRKWVTVQILPDFTVHLIICKASVSFILSCRQSLKLHDNCEITITKVDLSSDTQASPPCWCVSKGRARHRSEDNKDLDISSWYWAGLPSGYMLCLPFECWLQRGECGWLIWKEITGERAYPCLWLIISSLSCWSFTALPFAHSLFF